MNFLARLPSREIEGAHEVLDGLVGEVSSGNQCRVWPAMTYVPQTNQTRIAFFVEWRFPSTPEDDAELMALHGHVDGQAACGGDRDDSGPVRRPGERGVAAEREAAKAQESKLMRLDRPVQIW